ncbi:MAG TPA: hypothetical protein VEI97_11875 [bacterium]|nr:hypothetical protein [bacterium]
MKRLRAIEAGWKLFWVFAILYWAFPSARYYWDGVEYAQLAERAVDWRETLHPHHVFYNLLVLWITRFFVEPLGYPHPGLVAQQWFNGLLGAFTVMFSYRTLRYFFTDPLAWQVAAIGGSAFTFWQYAAGHAPYIPAGFRLVIAFQVMAMSYKDPHFKPSKLFMLAIHFFLATMLHQASALLLIPWVYFLFRRTEGMEDAITYRVAGLLFSVGLIAFHYILFGFASLRIPDLPTFLHWALGYGEDRRWWYLANHPWWTLPWAIVKSHVITFLYPDYTFAGFLRWPEGNLALDLIKKVLVLLVLRHLIPGFIGGLQHLGLFFRLQPRVLAVYWWWWVGLLSVFFAVFQPQQPFYRLFYLLPLLMVLAVGFDRGWRIAGRTIGSSAWGLLAPLFLFNFFAGILPQANPAKNPWLVEATALVHALDPGTVVVLPGDPGFSIDESVHGTRTWELVEYLGGELPGVRGANAIEVLYLDPWAASPEPIDLFPYLVGEAGEGTYTRLLVWPPDEGSLSGATLSFADRTFAWKGLRPELQRWDHTVTLPRGQMTELRGQRFVAFP